MQYRVTCSTADGNQTKDFNTWEDAHLYANEWMDGFTHWNHLHFNSVESDNYENLWKTRNGETVRIEKIDCPNCADQASQARFFFRHQPKTQNRKERKMKLTQVMDIYTEGIGRVIASGYAKRKCIPFLEGMRLLPMLWVRDNGIQLKYVTHINFKTKDDYLDSMGFGFCPNCADQASIAAPGQTTLCKTHIENARIEIENCEKCAIARQYADVGETMLCKDHYQIFSEIEGKILVTTVDSVKAHYADMKDFFIKEIERLQFKSSLPFCSACGTDKRVHYIGVIPSITCGFLNFSFCVDCRDELTLKKNAAIAAQERIGA